MKELEEVLRLFKAALESLTQGRDHVTSKAYFGQAQTLLDELEKDMRSKAGAFVRKARPAIRKHLLQEKSLRARFESTLSFWSQMVEGGTD